MKQLLVIIFFAGLASSAAGQDYLLTFDSTVYKGHITRRTSESIDFQLDDSTGAVLEMATDSLLMVTRETGGLLVFHNAGSIAEKAMYSNGLSLYDIGAAHAHQYYDQYDEAQYSTLAISLVAPPAGLVFAIISASTTPSKRNLGFPSSTLWDSYQYRQGYARKARKIKGHKVWDKFGLGLGINIALAAAIYLMVR
jgi:hypothetical protein